MDGYNDCVKVAWDRPMTASKNSLATLHIELSKAAKALRTWSKNIASQSKIAMAVSREVIHQLKIAQESR
jgi:hypothetical protein